MRRGEERDELRREVGWRLYPGDVPPMREPLLLSWGYDTPVIGDFLGDAFRYWLSGPCGDNKSHTTTLGETWWMMLKAPLRLPSDATNQKDTLKDER
jgi:hypothetical protein